jgi:DNA processing protein
VSSPKPNAACRDCARRSWLLARLSPTLDYRCSDAPRLTQVLSLDNERLIEALAGGRRNTLKSEYRAFAAADSGPGAGTSDICRHDPGYPDALRDAGAPPLLNVRGDTARLLELLERPAVAVVGARRASDYGLEVARGLGQGLAASGVTVIGTLREGISNAVHVGALEAGGAVIPVVGDGFDVACRGRHRSLFERVSVNGCVVSELPCDGAGRRWGPTAAARIVVRLASLTVVVEADDSARELASSHIARTLGRTVAAVPGRVSSRASRGTNAMLMDGSPLVRDAEDVLELLPARPAATRPPARVGHTQLEPRLAEVLERVGEGRDSPDGLAAVDEDPGGLLLALSELELMGLLTRGDGGRYLAKADEGIRTLDLRHGNKDGTGRDNELALVYWL